ncbi:MAG: NUDIX pyrophosphatase [Chloroflexi bacterium]|nr:NUDIX pyrophosphatase [Chloroflexota bacterium]
MVQRQVVTAFLEHQGQILLLKRSQRVGTFRGRWAGVSGGIPEGVRPLSQALREIEEEVGLPELQVELLRSGDPVVVTDEEDHQWLVHPFLFRIGDPSQVLLDWEHTESRWVKPEEIARFHTVPGLKQTWDQLWKT